MIDNGSPSKDWKGGSFLGSVYDLSCKKPEQIVEKPKQNASGRNTSILA
jgi:hypothetical protein